MPARHSVGVEETMPIRHLSGAPGQLSPSSAAKPKPRYIFIKGKSFTLK